MVFKKQANENGNYVGQDGKRYDVLFCERTESKKWRQIGTETQEIDGQSVQIPLMESYIAINDGWDAYENLEVAAQAYGLTYDPQEPKEPDYAA